MKELMVLLKQFETTECHLSPFFWNNVATNLEIDPHQRLNCFQRSLIMFSEMRISSADTRRERFLVIRKNYEKIMRKSSGDTRRERFLVIMWAKSTRAGLEAGWPLSTFVQMFFTLIGRIWEHLEWCLMLSASVGWKFRRCQPVFWAWSFSHARGGRWFPGNIKE